MPNKTDIEYLDLVILKITDITNFNVWNTLREEDEFNFEQATEEQKRNMLDISSKVESLGMTYEYFQEVDYTTFTYALTEKGIRVRELGGHNEYKKLISKKPIDRYRIIQICLTILFSVLTLYFAYLNYDLKLKQSQSDEKATQLEMTIQQSNSKMDSLNTVLDSYKNKLDKLKTKEIN